MEEKMRIFFCEDDENLGMLLREYLQAKGYETDLFTDGEAGYKGFTKGTKYDLCVLDVMMPKKDGFTLAQEIHSINPDIPIIFLTAKTQKEDILEGFKHGADDYLTKPACAYLGTNGAFMIFDDLAYIRQTQSKSFHVMHVASRHTEEAVEHLLEVFLLDAYAVVFHRNQQLAVLVPRAAYQFERHIGPTILHGVVHQVEQHVGDVHLVYIDV